MLPVLFELQWLISLEDTGAGCSLADEELCDLLFAAGVLWGVWKTIVPHEWGGLTRESTTRGHRVPGTEWAIAVGQVRTTTSNLAKWVL